MNGDPDSSFHTSKEDQRGNLLQDLIWYFALGQKGGKIDDVKTKKQGMAKLLDKR